MRLLAIDLLCIGALLPKGEDRFFNRFILLLTHLALALLDVVPTSNSVQEGADLANPLVRVLRFLLMLS